MTSSANLTVPSLFDFRNHVVLVTGGATGLGEMAAQAFVQNGARVFIASRKENELKKARYMIAEIDALTVADLLEDQLAWAGDVRVHRRRFEGQGGRGGHVPRGQEED
jgi:NAD(P)-dependent dehydrogenase (short-subunit alcohol dehydrogenase family)